MQNNQNKNNKTIFIKFSSEKFENLAVENWFSETLKNCILEVIRAYDYELYLKSENQIFLSVDE